MKVRETTVWHEIIILLIYLFVSPIIFGVVYPEKINGDGELIYVAILFNALLTLVVSLIIILPIKLTARIPKMEICYGLIPLALSFIFFICILPDANKKISETYYISNLILIIGIYLVSILIKVKK